MTHTPRNDDGIAMVVALLVMLAFSALGAAALVLSRTETLSSLNYRMMSQARYGAESGVHKAAHFLLNTYDLPPTVSDPMANYDITASPVTYLGQPVVLSAMSGVAANYPVNGVQAAFAAAAQGSLPAGQTTVIYEVTATLIAMRDVIPYGAATPTSAQTWELTAKGRIEGSRMADVEVRAVMERQVVPAHTFAAFATNSGCGALTFGSGVITDSYDSGAITFVSGQPATDNHTGHVGTNGNLTTSGQAQVNGALSTPRSGVGKCKDGAVTALTANGVGQVGGGISQLPQAVAYPVPEAPSPAPPTGDKVISSSATCTTFALASGNCTKVGSVFTLDPQGSPMALADIKVTAGTTLTLHAGTYNMNSITLTGNAQLIIASGPVVLNIMGTGQSTPVDFLGGAVSNPSYDPSNFRILYGGTGEMKLTGGSDTAAIVYAPRANAKITGNGDLWGSVLAAHVDIRGGAALHYDRRLNRDFFTIGPQMMSSFTWKAQ
jgi:Tfp pilus assembly protein PilX